MAVLLAFVLTPDHFRGKDITWFGDNEAAVSSMIRGASTAEDVGHLAAAAQLAFLQLGARVWFEWVDTKSNPADGLSRGGLSDQWTRQQSWDLEEFSEDQMQVVVNFLYRHPWPKVS